ncbi:MAG: OPT family oligopeptide transporter [Candidatus Glassbacteria bacterium]
MEEKRGLSPEAYEEVPGDSYVPYILDGSDMIEFTVKALVLGSIFGILFGAANAYLGLRVGLTISTSIPVAVMTVAVFRSIERFIGPSTLLENNIAKTVGSASSSLASGIIFTIPALFLWGTDADIWTVTTVALGGGILGVLFMVPLRRFLITGEHGRLPYPEGTAAAEVLVAAEIGGTHAKNVFTGMGIGAFYKWLMSGLNLWKTEVSLRIPFIKKAEVGLDVSPALLGVGYILGFRIALIMVSGGLLAWLGLIPAIAYLYEGATEPLFPEKSILVDSMTAHMIWTRYIRYVGAGAVASAGIITLIRSIPTMVSSFRIGLKGVMRRMNSTTVTIEERRTQADLSLVKVLVGIAIITIFLALTPTVFGFLGGFSRRLVASILVAIFAFFFTTVSARIVGLVGVTSNPTSGMIIATLICTSLVFVIMGFDGLVGKVAILLIGAVVGVSASIAGDTSQDLKTGFLLGATPHRQQVGELVGVLTTAFFVAGSVLMLERQYGFGSVELPAPQANMMKLVIDGVLEAEIPWRLVLLGIGITLIVEIMKLPSLAFAVGVYLPVSTMTPLFVGGLVRRIIESRAGDDLELIRKRREKGILYGSGLVGGDGLVGVGIAFWAGAFGIPEGFGTAWAGGLAGIIPLVFFMLLVYLLVRSTREDAAV